MNVNDTGCRPILINVWEDNEYCHVVPIADSIHGHLYKANQSILLVSRPPLFKVLCGWAVIIHYSICHFEGVAS